ncbi:MAG: tripartite tricarboxylate transporter TctB family protein [Burkholderiales bacterium]
MSIETPSEGRPSARADVVSGAVWLAIGVAIVIGSWQMDRLEKQGVQWFAAPGLVPGILGLFILGTALLIVARSVLRVARETHAGATAGDASLGRATLTLVLCFAFAAGMVGHGLPFGMAAAIYLFLHIFLLELPERRARGEVARGALVAGAVAVGVATTVTLIFQELFLVRLP